MEDRAWRCQTAFKRLTVAMNKPRVEAIGWVSTALLLVTLLRQLYTEWRSGSTQGVSKWLFVVQMAASVGFTTYSWLLRNWVFMGSSRAARAEAISLLKADHRQVEELFFQF